MSGVPGTGQLVANSGHLVSAVLPNLWTPSQIAIIVQAVAEVFCKDRVGTAPTFTTDETVGMDLKTSDTSVSGRDAVDNSKSDDKKTLN